MIIPSKIRIGGQDISIINKERLDDNNLGNICVAEGVLQTAENFGIDYIDVEDFVNMSFEYEQR